MPGVAEPADFEHDAVARFFRDAEHASNQGLLRAPQMQQARFAPAHSPRIASPASHSPFSRTSGVADGAQSIEGPS